mmetsp:Transcript_15311/g.43136  ORF Transcript_15311/g.43136 Transcript_15311/m.43136 type:complete len:230 (+) Transcript_15311:306-995(+)
MTKLVVCLRSATPRPKPRHRRPCGKGWMSEPPRARPLPVARRRRRMPTRRKTPKTRLKRQPPKASSLRQAPKTVPRLPPQKAVAAAAAAAVTQRPPQKGPRRNNSRKRRLRRLEQPPTRKRQSQSTWSRTNASQAASLHLRRYCPSFRGRSRSRLPCPLVRDLRKACTSERGDACVRGMDRERSWATSKTSYSRNFARHGQTWPVLRAQRRTTCPSSSRLLAAAAVLLR